MKHSISVDSAVRQTTFIESTRLNQYLGARVILASETFQHTGSFKFRAAFNVASKVAQNGLITASSGNFGQALAMASMLLKKTCVVVMPLTSARTKIDGVREYGGRVELIDTRSKSRLERVKELALENPGFYVASPFDDPLVIEGNSSLGREIACHNIQFDAIVAPVGGGGLISGLIVGCREAGRSIPILGAEPLIANDAARSLREGRLVANDVEPQTIADGVRTLSLGKCNWEIIRNHLQGIIEIPEEKIEKALGLLFVLANLKAEPTGALSLAAVLTQLEAFRDRTICCVVSGGNVDSEVYARILTSSLS